MALKIKFHQTWWIAGGKNGINGAFSLLLMTRSLPEGRSHHVPHEGATEQVQREAQPFAAFLLAPPPSGFGMFYWTLLTRLRNRGTQVTLQTPVKSTFYSCMTVFMADQVLGCISPTSQCLGFCRGYGLLCALRVVKLPSPCARQFWRKGSCILLPVSAACTRAWLQQHWALRWNKRVRTELLLCWANCLVIDSTLEMKWIV